MLPSPPTLSSAGRTELLSAGAWTGSAGLSGLVWLALHDGVIIYHSKRVMVEGRVISDWLLVGIWEAAKRPLDSS